MINAANGCFKKIIRNGAMTIKDISEIYPRETQSMENIARYIIRASFSQERMNYMVNESKVIYKSKNGNDTKEFD